MQIQLENIGKRFNREWIFRNIQVTFEKGTQCAILGGNGSGKSTLLQVLSGYLTPSEGVVNWADDSGKIPSDKIFRQLSLATPYMSVHDEFTLKENFEFFQKFKRLRNDLDVLSFAQRIGLEPQLNKQLKFFSSGMRQRVKLGLAILGDTELLLLDEPTSHLDANAIGWYQELLKENSSGRSVFVASNSHADEIFLCTSRLVVDDYK